MGYGSKEGGKKIYREYGWSGSLVGGEYVKSAWRMWRVVTARHHASSPQPAPVQEGGSPLLNLFPKITVFYNNVTYDYTKLIHPFIPTTHTPTSTFVFLRPLLSYPLITTSLHEHFIFSFYPITNYTTLFYNCSIAPHQNYTKKINIQSVSLGPHGLSPICGIN